MSSQQDSSSMTLGKFAWERDAEQDSPKSNQQRPLLQLPQFAWEKPREYHHETIFNDLALERKFKTKSGATDTLAYREPRFGPSTGTPAASPPTGVGWNWLDGESVCDSNDLKPVKGHISGPSSSAPSSFTRTSYTNISTALTEKMPRPSARTVNAGRTDWSQADEEPRGESVLKRLFSRDK